MLSDLVFWHENWTLFTSDCCICRKNNSNSETYLLNFLSVIEDILILLISGLCYLFTLFLSSYSTFYVFLFGCFSYISTFFLWEISSLFIGCVTNPLYNQVWLDKLMTLLMTGNRWCFIFRLILVIPKIKQNNYLRKENKRI